MKKFLRNHPYISAYTVFVLCSVLLCTGRFAQDRIGRANGSIAEQSYTVDELDLRNLEAMGDGGYVSTWPDPQLIFPDYTGVVNRVDVVVSLSRDPGEFNLFYMLDEDMVEFSAYQRTWATKIGDDHYVLQGPRKMVYGLRLDPGIFSNNEMYFYSITVNPEMPFSSFFTPGYAWFLCLFAVPPLLVAGVGYLVQVYAALKKRAAKNGKPEEN